MILCYHKIFPVAKTHWWVTVDRFYRQLAALQSYNVVSLDRYDPKSPDDVVITFDGVYDNILLHALPVLRQFSYPFELFVIGDWIGRVNTFDQIVEPPCQFATLDQLDALVAEGARVQWHTRSHRRFSSLTKGELESELTVPTSLRARYKDRHLNWFAYPHGDTNDLDHDLVRRHFDGALACDEGDKEERYNLPRLLVFEHHDFFRAKVSATIYLGSVPWLIRDTLASLAQQIVPPDSVRVVPNSESAVDDAQPIIDALEAGGRTDIVSSPEINVEQGDYQIHLSAGDCLRSDHLLTCRVALDRNPEISVVTVNGPLPDHTQGVVKVWSNPALGSMQRGEVDGTSLSLNASLFVPCPSSAEEVSQLRIGLCHREGELIQRTAIELLRDREIQRLNEANRSAQAEIDRLAQEHSRNASEILRLNYAYSHLDDELRRVSEAYGDLSRELARVNGAYGELHAELECLRSPIAIDQS